MFLEVAFRGRNVLGTFEKRAPGPRYIFRFLKKFATNTNVCLRGL